MTALSQRTQRSGPQMAEWIALLTLIALDTAFGVRLGAPHSLSAAVAIEIAPGLGPVAAVLALLRRRFPNRVGRLGVGAAGLSLLGTVLTALTAVLGQPIPPQPSATEALALALLVGAGCHRLPARAAAGLAGLGGLAMVAAPVLRFGVGSPAALLAVPAALLWGGGLAVGLILRDAATRRDEALRAARSGERLRLARELHDLVAHHITGVVVRAQAARVVARTEQPSDEVFVEIEHAGAEALSAMRRLVGMLRTEAPHLGPAPDDLAEADRGALPEDGRTRVMLPADLAEVPVTPETARTVHRIVLEALTNARRHAPRATELLVELRIDDGWLEVEVVNDGVRSGGRRSGGYGLLGMTERITALGGSLHAGEESGQRWRVTARLPVEAEVVR